MEALHILGLDEPGRWVVIDVLGVWKHRKGHEVLVAKVVMVAPALSRSDWPDYIGLVPRYEDIPSPVNPSEWCVPCAIGSIFSDPAEITILDETNSEPRGRGILNPS